MESSHDPPQQKTIQERIKEALEAESRRINSEPLPGAYEDDNGDEGEE